MISGVSEQTASVMISGVQGQKVPVTISGAPEQTTPVMISLLQNKQHWYDIVAPEQTALV